MGLALLAIIWLITFVSTYFFVAQTWWLPHGVSTSTAGIDHQFAVTYVLMGIVFVAAQGALGLFVWQYRDQGKATKVTYSHGNTKMEVIWTTLTAILFIGLNLMGSPIWAAERFAPADAGSVPVEVTGMQFAWYFRYPTECARERLVGERGFEPPTPWSRTWGEETKFVAIQSFEWCFNRLILAQLRQFWRNVNPQLQPK
jgi:heme/copper-type cytochrome/quinol oxidase subunit 2